MEKQMDNGMGTEVCRYVWLCTLRSVLHPLRIMSQSGPQLSLHHDRGGWFSLSLPTEPAYNLHKSLCNLYSSLFLISFTRPVHFAREGLARARPCVGLRVSVVFSDVGPLVWDLVFCGIVVAHGHC